MKSETLLNIFLCGDVMTGRGIDQILNTPSDSTLHEPYVRDAKEYVKLARRANGHFPDTVDFKYIWGDALEQFDLHSPDLKIINLETSITESKDFIKTKAIHYKMHPKNIPALTNAGIDGCSLANNHILDWSYSGLHDTVEILKQSGLRCAGVGKDIMYASAPALFEKKGTPKVFLFSYGSESSGISANWAATQKTPGVNLLKDFSESTFRQVKENLQKVKGHFVIFSIHWGENWGYQIESQVIEFAHRLIDDAGVSVIHGHSSHHVKGIEVYKSKLILYGCGDFITDYEGIAGYEEFRGDLGLMYFASFDPVSGNLVELEMVPTKMKKFRVTNASRIDAEWLQRILNLEGKQFGTSVDLSDDNLIRLRSAQHPFNRNN